MKHSRPKKATRRSPPAPAPACLLIDFQKTGADCAVSALAMLSGQPYRKVSEAALTIAPKVHRRGMWTPEILAAASRVGCPLGTVKLAGKLPGEEATGLLTVAKRDGSGAHATVLFQGVLIDPMNQMVWDVETFLAQGWVTVALHPPKSKGRR